MKRIYQRLERSAFPLITVGKFFLACIIIFLTIPSIGFCQELIFKDPILVSGEAGKNNAIYRFKKVGPSIDALLKIRGRSATNVIVENIDVSETGWNKSFQPKIGISGGVVSGTKDWWMEFEVSFVKAGTSELVEVNEFNLTSLDVDGDNLTIREYVELFGASSYYFESATELLNSPINNDGDDDDSHQRHGSGGEKDYRFLGPIKNYLDIDTAATRVMVTSRFTNKNKINFRIGARSMGFGTTNAAIRYNSLWFRSFNYQAVVFLPVKLTSFTAKSLSSDKIMLNWNTAQEKNFSHFTIEKSLDGKDFSDAGLIFSMGDSDLPKQYSFTDNLRTGEKGMVYYRLKMVDIDGKSQHSSIRMIRVGEEKANASIMAYPNPAVNELRVTLPATWQEKKVVIDIFTTNGILAKRFISNNASQTETINVRALSPGSYLVRSSSGAETSSQHIIKTN